jgi:SnoaL-like domain
LAYKVSLGGLGNIQGVVEEGFSEGRLDVVDEFCAEGFVGHDPIAGDQDVEGVKGSIAGYRDAFPDLSFTIDDIFAADDKVVLRWTARSSRALRGRVLLRNRLLPQPGGFAGRSRESYSRFANFSNPPKSTWTHGSSPVTSAS